MFRNRAKDSLARLAVTTIPSVYWLTFGPDSKYCYISVRSRPEQDYRRWPRALIRPGGQELRQGEAPQRERAHAQERPTRHRTGT